jgi:hypothetical protein
LARPKEFGGLGFTDTRLVNKCLLSKWIFKIERGDVDLCNTLLRRKYLRGEEFFSVGMLEEHHNSGNGWKYVVGKGNKARFWHEVWLGECPLRIRFNKIFSICKQQNWEVARVLKDKEVNLSFRRNFDNGEVLKWEELERELEGGGGQLNNEEDTVRWALTNHGHFTIASLYKQCSFSGVLDVRMEDLWHSKLPLKQKLYLHLVQKQCRQLTN